MPNNRRDLRFQLLILYLLFVIVIFALAVFYYLQESRRLHQEISTSDITLTKTIASETEDILLKAKHAAISFAQMEALIEANPSEMEAIFIAGASARQDVNRIARLTAKGIMRYHYPATSNSSVGQDFSFEPYFQNTRTSGSHVFSNVRVSPTTGNLNLISAAPIFRNDEFDGVVTINFELTRLTEKLSEINQLRSPNNQILVRIIDNQRRIIAQTTDGPVFNQMPSLQLFEEALSGKDGSVIERDAEGIEWIYGYTPITSSGWAVVLQHQTDLAFESLARFRQGLILAMVIFGLGAALFWLFLSKRIIGPLQRLTDYSRTVGQTTINNHSENDDIQPLSQRGDQIGELAQTLLGAEHSVKLRVAELTTLNKTSTAVLSMLETQQVIDTILDEVQRLLDIRLCALQVAVLESTQLHVRASRGLPDLYIEQLNKTSHALDLPAFRAIHMGQAVQISDLHAPDYASLRPLAKLGRFRSLLAIPLTPLHGPPAALVIYRPDTYQFTREEIDLATTFANHAAIALEHAHLFSLTDAELQKQVSFLSALHTVGHTVSQSLEMDEILSSAIDTVFEVTPSDSCWIFLCREAEEFLRLRAHRGLPPSLLAHFDGYDSGEPDNIPSHIMTSNKPLLLEPATPPNEKWLDDPLIADSQWRWVAAAPLRAKETPIGVLGMATQANEPYTENELDLLQSFGDQIAIAVVNSRLYRRSHELATLEERNRVAREIHDTLIQSLTGILVHLQGAKRLSTKQPEQASQMLEDALELSQESLREARRSVLNLRPVALEELPLDKAIEEQVQRIARENQLHSDFKLEGYPSFLKSDVEQHLYRISQEALTNIKRHAKATEVRVRLSYRPQAVVLTIADDGIGLEHSERPKAKNGDGIHNSRQNPQKQAANHHEDQHGFGLGLGLGLLGIQERVRLVGGNVTIESSAVQGTMLKVVIPK